MSPLFPLSPQKPTLADETVTSILSEAPDHRSNSSQAILEYLNNGRLREQRLSGAKLCYRDLLTFARVIAAARP